MTEPDRSGICGLCSQQTSNLYAHLQGSPKHRMLIEPARAAMPIMGYFINEQRECQKLNDDIAIHDFLNTTSYILFPAKPTITDSAT